MEFCLLRLLWPLPFIFFLTLLISNDHNQQQTLTQITSDDRRIGVGITINIKHCYTDLSAHALEMKEMLENYLPGVSVILEDQPPTRENCRYIRVVQVGVVGIMVAVERFLPRRRALMVQHISMTRNIWLLGDSIISTLRTTGAFEVYFNGELIFSKLEEERLPSEFELRELVSRKVADSRTVDGLGAGVLWV